MYLTKILFGFGEAVIKRNNLEEACDEVKRLLKSFINNKGAGAYVYEILPKTKELKLICTEKDIFKS